MPSCETTASELVRTRYTTWRIIFVLTGLLGIALTAFHIKVIFRRGTNIQRSAFPFLLLCSFTFFIRGLDPNGYGGTIPMLLSQLMWATASACLYSVW